MSIKPTGVSDDVAFLRSAVTVASTKAVKELLA